ncbi:MAG: hypothetical protein LBF88_10215 [Planctomycetaceae bacterium]|jgi:hypothetical protein|nr:hypothetical protein [Planctomycetaceae bacterium]
MLVENDQLVASNPNATTIYMILDNASNPFGQGNPYAGLSITLRGICYLDIAINDYYSSAIGSLFSAARARNWLYEKQGCRK